MKWTYLHRHPSLKEFHKARGDTLLAGAFADGKSSLETLPLDRPICFLFGNKKEGISDEAKKGCDLLFRVPMYGMVESYNLICCRCHHPLRLFKEKKGGSAEGWGFK